MRDLAWLVLETVALAAVVAVLVAIGGALGWIRLRGGWGPL